MLPITTINDYTGFNLTPSNRHSELQNIINYFEPLIIREIFNDNVYKDISTQDPLQQKYIDLIAGGFYTNKDDKEVYFRGLKEALIHRIYYDFNRQNFTPTQSGTVKNAYETSTPLTTSQLSNIIFERYNKFVDIYCEDLHPFLLENEVISTNINIALGGVGFTNLEVDSTKYLYVGDFVTVDGKEYEVDQLVEDVVIICKDQNEELISKNNFEVSWKPYYELETKHYDKQWFI